MTLPSGVV